MDRLNPTNFGEIKRRCALGLKQYTGEDNLIVEQSIRDAINVIVQQNDFDWMLLRDDTTVSTVQGERKILIYDFLPALKDIYTVKPQATNAFFPTLKFLSHANFMRSFIEEEYSFGLPAFYTLYGHTMELHPTPDQVYQLKISYCRWPNEPIHDDDLIEPQGIDHVIVALARDIMNAYQGGTSTDFTSKARQYLNNSIKDDRSRAGAVKCARGFRTSQTKRITPGEFDQVGNKVLNPWVRR